MNKITTKAIALFTALLILMTALPMSATAATADGEPVSASGKTGDVNWSLSGTELTISGYGRMADYVYDYSSKTPWGYDITSVNILPGVENIGKYAFKFCSKLTSVTIGNNVESIGESAFFLCTAITDISLPDSVAYIGDGAFANCTHMETIRMPAHSDYLGYDVFNSCSALKSVDIPEGITWVNGKSFFWCRNLKHITVPSTLTGVSSEAFLSCYGLKELELPDSVTFIGTRAFGYCEDLESVNIPSAISSIPAEAFIGCESLTDLEISGTITSIGDDAFFGCTSLSDIGYTDFNDAVRHADIGVGAFYNTAWFSAQPVGIYYIGDAVYGTNAVEPVSLTIRDGATGIMEGAFHNCPALTGITVPDSITEIPANTFNNCDGLLSITLPESITKIGDYAFAGSSALETAIVSGDIGKHAFESCAALKEVAMIKNTTTVGNSAFNECRALEKVRLADSVTTICTHAFYYCYGIKRLVLPKSIETLEDDAFYYCSFESVWVSSPDTVIKYYYEPRGNTRLEYPFRYAGDFTVYAPSNSQAQTYATTMRHPFVSTDSPGACSVDDGVLTISGNGTMPNYSESAPAPWTIFDGCFPGETGYITSVEIQDGVSGIGSYAFAGLTDLTSVTMPETLTTINASAFENCTSLSTLPDMSHVTYLGKNALSNTAWLNAQEDGVVYANDILVTCKGDSPALYAVQSDTRVVAAGAFSGSQTLEQIGISEGVKYINDDAFNNCPNLIAAGFGHDHVFGAGAFLNCPQLVFYGPKKSTAYTYAIDHNILYGVMIDESGDCEWFLHNGNLTVSGEGAMADYASSAQSPFAAGITSIVLEEGVTSVGNYSFADLPNLTSVTLPSTLTRIGGHAFENAAALTSVTIPASVTEIGEDAFAGCENLTIYGYDGTVAQSYANSHNIPFVALKLSGDVNGDNKVNIRDVTFIQRFVGEFIQFTDEQLALADVDGNGVVDINDATLLQMFLAEYDVVLV